MGWAVLTSALGGSSFLPPGEHSMARSGGQINGVCATSTTGTVEAPAVEIMIGKDLTIDQFEHTELIGENITLGINSVAIDVGGRTIIAAEEEAVIFDRLHQCPQTQQVGVTIEVVRVDLFTSTNAGIDLLFDLCRFLIRNKGGSGCHLAGKLANFLYIGKGRLTVLM